MSLVLFHLEISLPIQLHRSLFIREPCRESQFRFRVQEHSRSVRQRQHIFHSRECLYRVYHLSRVFSHFSRIIYSRGIRHDSCSVHFLQLHRPVFHHIHGTPVSQSQSGARRSCRDPVHGRHFLLFFLPRAIPPEIGTDSKHHRCRSTCHPSPESNLSRFCP